MDLKLPDAHKNKPRRDWGLQNIVGLSGTTIPKNIENVHRERMVRSKIDNFINRAVFPQQLTIPRQYATTQEGVSIYKMLEGRVIDGIQEQGVRAVVLENAKFARFVMSPLMPSRSDAEQWARRNMGLTNGNG